MLRFAHLNLRGTRTLNHRLTGLRLAVLVGLIALNTSALAKEVWVTDEFEVMMRSGKGTNQRIIEQLKSGTRLEALEEDSAAGFTRVRTRSGKEGWVLSRYVQAVPTAKLRLPTLNQQLQRAEEQSKELQQQVATLREEKQRLQSQLSALQSDNRSLEGNLERITRLSSDTIEIDSQNKQLRQRLVDAELELETLQADNARLDNRANREWFLVGGAVLTLGLLLGLILPRINWRRKSSWSDF